MKEGKGHHCLVFVFLLLLQFIFIQQKPVFLAISIDSQHKNKAKALKLIAARVNDMVSADEARQRGDAKNSLMGGGDRSERIRTYNFPQDRITDHRCKHSEHGIEKLLSCGNSGSNHGEDTGLVGVFAPFMGKMERDEILETIEEEERRSISSKDNHKQ